MPDARSALITGASSGIGAACAAEFLSHGWSVIGWDVSPAADDRIRWTAVDVSDWDSVATAAADLPPLGAVVNCAGVSSRTPAVEMTRVEWDRVIAINLSGTFYVARWAHDALAAGRGTLINIASITADAGFRNRAAYSVTKAGVVILSRQLAIEWAPDGIRVLAISPGFTQSPMLQEGVDAGLTDPAEILRHTPQGRLLPPHELAGAIVALTDDAFSGVTGSQILVDGGFNALTGF